MKSFPRAIAHIDADCFFASVELRDAPNLRGKPVLVCSRVDRRGIVLAATYEARPTGIRAGTPVFKAKNMCPEAIIIPAHPEKYIATSRHLMALLRDVSPEVETASIDEAYMDMTGLRLLYRTDYEGIAEQIKAKVSSRLGVTVSIGVAPTKLLAKIASNVKKPNGVTMVPSQNIDAFLKTIPIKDIPGVGQNTQALLTKYAINTAHDIVQYRPLIERLLGKRGQELALELSGVSISSVSTAAHETPQSLSCTRTFPEFLTNRDAIFTFALKLLTKLSLRLRRYELETGTLTFMLSAKDFSHRSQVREFSPTTDQDTLLIPAFREMFARLYVPGTTYRKVGFFAGNLHSVKFHQYSLFDTPTEHLGLSHYMDKIHLKHGDKAIFRGTLLSVK